MVYLKRLIPILLISANIIPACYAQTSNSLTTGSSNRLSISLSNTMGVRTTADAISNVEVDNEAVLILDPESKIQDSFDSSGEGISGDFVVSPNGASFDITGLQAENNYIIGEGSFFKSKMKSLEDPDPTKPIKGNASALLIHDMTLTVDQTNSSFTQAFSTDF
tara:strand:+ start:599 stop:1090 length:492 start_codon:yes stop_codon:yes gene_type:complete